MTVFNEDFRSRYNLFLTSGKLDLSELCDEREQLGNVLSAIGLPRYTGDYPINDLYLSILALYEDVDVYIEDFLKDEYDKKQELIFKRGYDANK